MPLNKYLVFGHGTRISDNGTHHFNLDGNYRIVTLHKPSKEINNKLVKIITNQIREKAENISCLFDILDPIERNIQKENLENTFISDYLTYIFHNHRDDLESEYYNITLSEYNDNDDFFTFSFEETKKIDNVKSGDGDNSSDDSSVDSSDGDNSSDDSSDGDNSCDDSSVGDDSSDGDNSSDDSSVGDNSSEDYTKFMDKIRNLNYDESKTILNFEIRLYNTSCPKILLDFTINDSLGLLKGGIYDTEIFEKFYLTDYELEIATKTNKKTNALPLIIEFDNTKQYVLDKDDTESHNALPFFTKISDTIPNGLLILLTCGVYQTLPSKLIRKESDERQNSTLRKYKIIYY